MAKYIAKRIFYALITIFVLISLTFLMMHLLPGEPFLGDKAMSEATKQAMRVKYGLDQPVLTQYINYIGSVLHGDLGTSITSNRPVATIIMESFPISFDLGVRAIILAVVFGIGLGSLAAIKRGRKADTFAMLVAVIGVSVPSFIIAALLQFFIALKLGQSLGTYIFQSVAGQRLLLRFYHRLPYHLVQWQLFHD